MASSIYNALFLCTGNSARSIIGEAILNRLGAGRFRAYSAGSTPRGEVHPFASDLLRKLNYETRGLTSKNWDVFSGPGAPQMDFVFTVCDQAAAESCPVWPGQPMTAMWSLPDPAAVTDSETEQRLAFADTYRMMHHRISIFTSLPIQSLEKIALQRKLDDIGKSLPANEDADA